MKIVMVKEPRGFIPANPIAAEDFAKIANGAEGLVSWTQPRNIRQFRLVWALAAKLADNYPDCLDRDDAMDLLKRRAKHIAFYAHPITGEVEFRTKSISWEKLSPENFSRTFKRMVWIITSELIPGMSDEALIAEIHEMLDGKRAT